MKFVLHCFLLLCLACPLAATNAAAVAPAAAEVIDTHSNFYRVDALLYRSRQPERRDLDTIRAHHIRTVVNLRYFDRDDDPERLAGADLQFINVPMVAWAVEPKHVAAALHRIEKAQAQGAVLVHCRHGADRTGIVIGMYRVLRQQWTLDQARREMTEGPFGFHRTWQNLRDFYTPQNVAAVQAELNRLRRADP